MEKNSENLNLENQAGFSEEEKSLEAREEVIIIEKDGKIDYSKRGLKGLEIAEPIVMPSEDVFNEAERIKAGDIKAHNAFLISADCKANNVEVGNSAFYFAYHCQVKNISGTNLFENAAGLCLVTENIKATTNFSKENSGIILDASIGNKSRGVIILGENIGEDVVYPSVIQMKDRVADDSAKIEEFFKNEFKKRSKKR